MKSKSLALSVSIAAALASISTAALAQPPLSALALNGVDVNEAPRVTQTINAKQLTVVGNSHFHFLSSASAQTSLPDDIRMNHLQLVLKPSAKRQAAMELFIAAQHDPKSAKFHQWLSPAQFGDAFGVQDADIATVTAWLTAQGFVVNGVYPNKAQIDFSGTVGQVKSAFHTQEAIYTLDAAKHLANATDIAIPTALAPVVAGVMGLNDFHAEALLKKPRIASLNTSKRGFTPKDAKSGAQGKSMALPLGDGSIRGLVPNDLMTMYGIREIRANGVVGKGVTIAVVEDNDMVADDWTNFTAVFNLQRFGGSFTATHPAPPSGATNCIDPNAAYGTVDDDGETLLDAEWATAIAPGANIVVASCADSTVDSTGTQTPTTENFFGGVYLSASNLINAATNRPDIISASYGFGEFFVNGADKTAIDLMWAQADAEGISVFVSTGDSGSNPSFNGRVINGLNGNAAVDANAFATSPHVTGVGGNDTADVLDGTSSKYFAPTFSAAGGSALSYVPEIPWNQSCGNGVAAKAAGFSGAVDFCKAILAQDPVGDYVTSEAGSGGPSSVDAKPAWQRQVYHAAKDQSRDLPDVSLFAGSYGGDTFVVTCTSQYPCASDFSSAVELSGGTSLSSPMFAGIQALIDQGLAARGVQMDQGNAAPTLYALAANQYGGAVAPKSDIDICNADHGATGTANCVFHNITRGSISGNCIEAPDNGANSFTTANCYYYGSLFDLFHDPYPQGLTTTDAAPTSYGVANKAYSAQPGWSFTSGLGSVNTRNLLIAWRAFVNAPPAVASVSSR